MSGAYEKLSKNTGLDVDQIKDLLAEEMLYKHHYKKEELEKVDLDLSGDVTDFIKDLCDNLKISEDAAFSSIFKSFLNQASESETGDGD